MERLPRAEGGRVVSAWSRRLATLCVVLISTTVALGLGELVLRALVNPGDFLVAKLIDDPVLGQRIAPHTTGHDALGLRNVALPAQANVVVLGDSQTYGVGVPREASWPHQLALLMREPVYSMALGGYGPLEYLHLGTHEARKLRPRLLLVGFYFGNDLAEACRVAHQRPYWKSWREESAGVVCDAEDPAGAAAEPKKRFAGLRDWLARHSVLYSMARVTVLAPLAAREKDRMAADLPADRQWIWKDPANPVVRTIFTPQLRLAAIDPNLAHVREGLRVAKRALAMLKDDADARGARFLVVLIPTKEAAYCRPLQSAGESLPSALLKLCEAEERVKADLIKSLAARNIAYVDAKPDLEEQVRRHVQIYPSDADGHPGASGHAVIARAVYNNVR